MYRNIHLPVLFAFLAAVRLSRPSQYPFVRTVFVLSFIPALVVIWIFPLAPPRWLTELGLGPAPADSELGAGGALFHNETAAAASQHFGFALFVAVVSLWLFPRSRIAWAAAAYPALVFFIIVGTGNHYVLDCVVGTLTFALAAVAALVLHGAVPARSIAVQPGAGIAAAGYGLIAGGLVTLHLTALTSWTNVAGATRARGRSRPRRVVTSRVDRLARRRTVDRRPLVRSSTAAAAWTCKGQRTWSRSKAGSPLHSGSHAGRAARWDRPRGALSARRSTRPWSRTTSGVFARSAGSTR